MGRKHCGKRRNWLLRAISPFPSVFHWLILQTRKNQGLSGKGLNHTYGVTEVCKWGWTLVSRTVGGATSPLIRSPTISDDCLSAIPSASGLILTAGGSSSHLNKTGFLPWLTVLFLRPTIHSLLTLFAKDKGCSSVYGKKACTGIVGKDESAGNQQFLHFSQKLLSSWSLKI